MMPWTAGMDVTEPSELAGVGSDFGVGSAIAIRPGRITRNGKNIFGTAAISGVRRAEVIESAAIARWTTRKSVHQYPNERTNPRPIARPNASTPSGLVLEWLMPTQVW